MSTTEFSWGKVKPAPTTENLTVLVKPNAQVWKEAQNSYFPLSFHNWVREIFTFTLDAIRSTRYLIIDTHISKVRYLSILVIRPEVGITYIGIKFILD